MKLIFGEIKSLDEINTKKKELAKAIQNIKPSKTITHSPGKSDRTTKKIKKIPRQQIYKIQKQIEEFKTLSNKHRAEVKKLQEEIIDIIHDPYKMLKKPVPDFISNSKTDEAKTAKAAWSEYTEMLNGWIDETKKKLKPKHKNIIATDINEVVNLIFRTKHPKEWFKLNTALAKFFTSVRKDLDKTLQTFYKEKETILKKQKTPPLPSIPIKKEITKKLSKTKTKKQLEKLKEDLIQLNKDIIKSTPTSIKKRGVFKSTTKKQKVFSKSDKLKLKKIFELIDQIDKALSKNDPTTILEKTKKEFEKLKTGVLAKKNKQDILKTIQEKAKKIKLPKTKKAKPPKPKKWFKKKKTIQRKTNKRPPKPKRRPPKPPK